MAAPVGSCLAVSSMDLCQLRSCFSISFLSSLLRAESSSPGQHHHVPLEDNTSSSGASVVAIDNKIEQAMDLVKSHLMYAVREEVEVLKEQIKELMERNSQLEQENNLLKTLASPEQMAQFQTQVMQSGPPLQPGPPGGPLQFQTQVMQSGAVPQPGPLGGPLQFQTQVMQIGVVPQPGPPGGPLPPQQQGGGGLLQTVAAPAVVSHSSGALA